MPTLMYAKNDMFVERQQNSYASLVDYNFEMSAGQGALPAPGGSALGIPDVGKALDELMGNKGKGVKNGGPTGPPPGDGEEPSNPIGDLFDRVTGKKQAKDDAKAKQKELLDKIGGKNPARDKWLFENIGNEAFIRASSMYDGPHSQYLKLSQFPQEVFFNIKQSIDGANTLDNHFDNQFAFAGTKGAN